MGIVITMRMVKIKIIRTEDIMGVINVKKIASIYNFHFIKFDNKARPMNM